MRHLAFMLRTTYLWMSLAALNIFPPLTASATCVDDPRRRCLSFESEKFITNATRTRLEYVPRGTTLQLSDNDASCNRPSQLVEANLCRIALQIDTSHRSGITFELWLPDDWPAGRLVSTGNGGVDGCRHGSSNINLHGLTQRRRQVRGSRVYHWPRVCGHGHQQRPQRDHWRLLLPQPRRARRLCPSRVRDFLSLAKLD